MKKIVLWFLPVMTFVLIGFPDQLMAGRFKQNPDHIPSIGISLGGGGLTGSNQLLDIFGQPFAVQAKQLFYDITVDFRRPISERLSIFGEVSFIGTISDSNFFVNWSIEVKLIISPSMFICKDGSSPKSSLPLCSAAKY